MTTRLLVTATLLGGATVTAWWNPNGEQCAKVESRDRRVASIEAALPAIADSDAIRDERRSPFVMPEDESRSVG